MLALPGDMIGFSHRGCLGWTINLATGGVPGWGLSHVAQVIAHPEDGHPILCEATAWPSQPCIIRGVYTDGLQCHGISARVWSYPGRVWRYPLTTPLMDEQSKQLTDFAVENLGRRYDYVGAFRARGAGFGWLERRLRKEDLRSLFCSEFVAAGWRAAGIVGWRNASAWSPNRLARAARAAAVVGKPERWK